MPFTFAHPAAVLPLSKISGRYLSMTALIIGSVIPDFEYFIRMKIQSDYSHTVGGLFWLDLPLAVLLYFIFRNIIRNDLIDNLPFFLRSRFLKYRSEPERMNGKKLLIVSISVLLGVVSHLLWDSFTHEDGYFVNRIPLLSDITKVAGFDIPVYKIVQHGSTLIGIVIILLFIFKLPKSGDRIASDTKIYWSGIVVLTVCIVAVRLFTGLNYKLYGHVIVTIISAGMISLFVLSLVMRLKTRINMQSNADKFKKQDD